MWWCFDCCLDFLMCVYCSGDHDDNDDDYSNDDGHYCWIDFIIIILGVHERCLDALAFETLIPKSVVQRYVSLLTEHKRAILCGPGGTGKTYLAGKLAEYLVIQWAEQQ